MFRLRIGQTLRTMRTAFTLAAVAVPGPALSDDLLAPDVGAGPQAQLVQRILESQTQFGQLSAELIEPWTELALHYQEGGDHALAIAAMARARQVVRANYGLYSLEEAPLLRLLVRSEDALGDAEGAWALEQQLLSLAERHRGDRRTIAIFREIGDRRLDVLERFLAGEFPPQVVLGCYYRNDSFEAHMGESLSGRNQHQSCRSGNRSDAAGRLLSETLTHYRAATNVMVDHDLYAGEALRDLEMSAVRALYAYITGVGQGSGRSILIGEALGGSCPACSQYDMGDSRLRRILDDAIRSEAPIAARIDALVQLADWRLGFWRGRRGDSPPALEDYALAYEHLLRRAVPQASIDAVFSPETPVVLPAFLPNPLVSMQTPESTGWIDVAFDITSHGRGERIEILDTTRASRAQSRTLVDLIRRSRFRPRVVDGELADASRVVLRYYMDD